MNYELAVLAALVQLEKPTTPKISAETGISIQRVRTAITNLKSGLRMCIEWEGAQKNGHYSVQSWGAFETGKMMRNQAMALNLMRFKSDKQICFDSSDLKRRHFNQTKHANYKHSLKLEGFESSSCSSDLISMDKSALRKVRAELKKRFTKTLTPA